jgi:hypothetical protein
VGDQAPLVISDPPLMIADSTINKIVEAKRAGVSCFISKPFRAEGLQAKILEMNKEYWLVACRPVILVLQFLRTLAL